MRGHAPGGNVGDIGTEKSRGHPLARQRLQLGAVGLDDIDVVAARPRFVERALHHLVAQRAPKLDLDSVLLLERVRERHRLRSGERRIQRERPLLPRPPGEALGAIAALVKVDCRVFLRRLGERERRARGAESERRNKTADCRAVPPHRFLLAAALCTRLPSIDAARDYMVE